MSRCPSHKAVVYFQQLTNVLPRVFSRNPQHNQQYPNVAKKHGGYTHLTHLLLQKFPYRNPIEGLRGSLRPVLESRCNFPSEATAMNTFGCRHHRLAPIAGGQRGPVPIGGGQRENDGRPGIGESRGRHSAGHGGRHSAGHGGRRGDGHGRGGRVARWFSALLGLFCLAGLQRRRRGTRSVLLRNRAST